MDSSFLYLVVGFWQELWLLDYCFYGSLTKIKKKQDASLEKTQSDYSVGR